MMEFITIKEAAKMLKWSEDKLRWAIAEGKIRAYKIGGLVRLKREDIEEKRRFENKIRSGYTVREVARMLSCSEVTVLRWIWRRQLKAERLDGKYYISPEELNKFVEGSEV